MRTPVDDPRVARSRAAVLAGTRELVASAGFAGLTIELIARRSGVARTTIYRHWPSLGALVFEAVASDTSTPSIVDSGDPWADIEATVRGLAAKLRDSEWARMLPALIDASSRDAEIHRLQTQRSAERRGDLAALIDEGKRVGVVAPDTDTEVLVELLVGPLFSRHLVSHLPVDDDFVDRVLAAARRVAAVA